MKQFLMVLLAALGMAAFTAPVFAQTYSVDNVLNAAVIDLTGKIPGGTLASSNTYHVTETNVKRFIQRCADKILNIL